MVGLSRKKGRSFLATCVCHTLSLFLFCVGHSNPCKHNSGINTFSKVKCQMIYSHRQSLKMGSTSQGFPQEIKAEDKNKTRPTIVKGLPRKERKKFSCEPTGP